jgi:hypothetical protein
MLTFFLILLAIITAPIWLALVVMVLSLFWILVIILWVGLFWLIGAPIDIKVKDKSVGYLRWTKFHRRNK